MRFRIGIGYDVHPLVPGRNLILGGVEVPFDKGLEGWSDADVLIHAVIDALLGAAGLGDIGLLFPPGDPKFKDISSIKLLEEVGKKVRSAGFEIINIDATIIAEAPKLSSYFDRMRENIASALSIRKKDINVKAKTSEKLGFLGRGEGIAAYAVGLLEEIC